MKPVLSAAILALATLASGPAAAWNIEVPRITFPSADIVGQGLGSPATPTAPRVAGQGG